MKVGKSLMKGNRAHNKLHVSPGMNMQKHFMTLLGGPPSITHTAHAQIFYSTDLENNRWFPVLKTYKDMMDQTHFFKTSWTQLCDGFPSSRTEHAIVPIFKREDIVMSSDDIVIISDSQEGLQRQFSFYHCTELQQGKHCDDRRWHCNDFRLSRETPKTCGCINAFLYRQIWQ